MDSSNLTSNPFANLFDNINEIQTYVPQESNNLVKNEENSKTSNTNIDSSSKKFKINNLIERVFQFTLRFDNSNEDDNETRFNYVFMGDDSNELIFLDKNNIDDVTTIIFCNLIFSILIRDFFF
jgi:hypothetical protein